MDHGTPPFMELDEAQFAQILAEFGDDHLQKRLDTLARDLPARARFVYPDDPAIYTKGDLVRIGTTGEAIIVDAVDTERRRLHVRRRLGAVKPAVARKGADLLIVGSTSGS
jgi:hypothetical protein